MGLTRSPSGSDALVLLAFRKALEHGLNFRHTLTRQWSWLVQLTHWT